MVAGGIAIRETHYDEITSAILKIKQDGGISGEMKWSEYRGGSRRAGYEAAVDLLFLLVEQNLAHFHCIISNFAAFNHRQHQGTPEVSVNRMYFQLGLHRLGQFYGKQCAIHIYPDYGNDSRELPNFRGVMCAYAYRTYGARPNCIRQVKAKDSSAEPILQMVDVVVGGIAAKRENRQLVAERAALADYILTKSGRPDWSTDTTANASHRLTVWNFQHQP